MIYFVLIAIFICEKGIIIIDYTGSFALKTSWYGP